MSAGDSVAVGDGVFAVPGCPARHAFLPKLGRNRWPWCGPICVKNFGWYRCPSLSDGTIENTVLVTSRVLRVYLSISEISGSRYRFLSLRCSEYGSKHRITRPVLLSNTSSDTADDDDYRIIQTAKFDVSLE